MVEHLESRKQHDQQLDYVAEKDMKINSSYKKPSPNDCNGLPEQFMSHKQQQQLQDYISYDFKK
jgi:hypothetical protein